MKVITLLSLLFLLAGCQLFTATDSSGSISNGPNEQNSLWLGDATPNSIPVGGSVTIDYMAGKHRDVHLIICNAFGQEIMNTTLTGGGSITWNGTDAQGNPCASGLYIYRMETGLYTSTRKMLMIK